MFWIGGEKRIRQYEKRLVAWDKFTVLEKMSIPASSVARMFGGGGDRGRRGGPGGGPAGGPDGGTGAGPDSKRPQGPGGMLDRRRAERPDAFRGPGGPGARFGGGALADMMERRGGPLAQMLGSSEEDEPLVIVEWTR